MRNRILTIMPIPAPSAAGHFGGNGRPGGNP
jgi:hypothetical protein